MSYNYTMSKLCDIYAISYQFDVISKHFIFMIMIYDSFVP